MDTNVVIPRYADIITTTIPRTRSHVGCLYSVPIMDFFLEAIKQIPRVIGRISPFNAPAKTRRVAGCPISTMIIVETAINPMITQFSFFSMAGWNVFKKDTEV